MMISFSDAYFNIFNLVPETCNIALVKLLDDSEKNQSKETIYNFKMIVEAPTKLEDYIPEDGEQDCKNISESSLGKQVTGPDIHKNVYWKVTDKDTEEQTTRKFVYSAHLIPKNIKDFVIKKGLYRITLEGSGIFF